MDNRCRVCQRSEVDELISLSCTPSTQELRISQMISKTTGAMLDDYDRLPQHLCDKCLGWLDQTYSVWKRFRVQTLLAKCEKGEEEHYHRCRICARNDSDELVSLFCICDSWKVSIDKMIYYFTKVKVKSGDCLPPYICGLCLQGLDVGYGFKKQYLDSEAALREEVSFAWEKMVCQVDDPGQLVVDLEAEMIPNWVTQGSESISSVHCSVCKLQIPLDQVDEQCEGCLLGFNNMEEVRKQIDVYGQKDSSEDPIGIDYEADDLGSENDTKPLEASTKNTSKIYSLDETNNGKYSDSPFQKISREGPICCGCNKVFSNNEEISEHMKTAHSEPRGSGTYSCERCLKKYSTIVELNRHKNLWRQYKVDYCKACHKYFPKAFDLLIHKEKFHMPIGAAEAAADKYTVDIQSFYVCCVKACKKHFNGEEQLLQHCNTYHQKEDELNRNTCQYCEEHFDDEDDLITHSNRKVESKIYCCAINGCILKNKRLDRILFHCTEVPHVPYRRLRPLNLGAAANIDVPMRGAAGMYIAVKQVSYRCCGMGCNLRFGTEATLLHHMIMSHPQPTEMTSNTCQYCGSHFAQDTVLLNHHSNRKLEWMKYLCTIDGCGFQAKSEGGAEMHFTKHTSIPTPHRKITSDAKPKLVAKKVVLYKDTVSTADEANEIAAEKYAVINNVYYRCCAANCNNRYKNEDLLLQHSNLSHYQADSLEPNTCQCCGLNFDQEDILSQHNSDRKVEWISYKCMIARCLFNSKVLETTKLHCDQNPHDKMFLKKSRNEKRNATPDMKHFTVTGDIDGIIDVLVRTTSEVCCRCFIFFETSEEKLLHYEESHAIIKDNNPFRCENCNTGFLHEGVMKHHIQTKGSENRTHYFCRPCQSFLWNDVYLKNHKAKMHDSSDDLYEQVVEELFMCCGCEKQFPEEEELIDHRRVNHTATSTRNPYTSTCDACQKNFKNKVLLEEHKSLYSSKLVYKCKVAGCVYQTKKLTTIKIHASGGSHRDIDGSTTYIHYVTPNEYRCCVLGCDYTNVSYDSIIEHGINEHVPKREENNTKSTHTMDQFICPVCCKRFNSDVRLINHKNGRKRQLCNVCGISCKIEEYDAHIEECKTQKKVKCEICSKELFSRALLHHMERVHSGRKRYQKEKLVCPICGKQLTKHHLPIHMDSHENKRQWKCKVCPQAFNTQTLLYSHSRVHADVKSFECRYGCGNRYKFDGDRTRHERQVHLGIMPFKCQCCSESFVRERDLRLHSRKHTGLKLYTCQYCPSGFNVLSEFKKHMTECSSDQA